jgi:FkbM family methyltransferase
LRAFIRHDSDDPFVLGECFGRRRAYQPPPEVESTLDAAKQPLHVVDLGANIGLFGLLAISLWPGSKVTGFEPDPTNVELHRRCIEANGLGDRWALVCAFAAARNGEVAFAGGRSSRSRRAEAGEAGATPVEAVDVFPYLDQADLIKIDIEGGEWELLGDERFASLPATAIALEYHRFRCSENDPQRAAIAAFQAAGYRTLSKPERAAPPDPHEGLGLIWAWR